MERRVSGSDPYSAADDEGASDMRDGSPEEGDPEAAALTADTALSDDFGTTADERHRGESLEGRLDRENPDSTDEFTDVPPHQRPGGLIDEEQEGVQGDFVSEDVAWGEPGQHAAARSPEEAAMRVEKEPE